MFYGRAQPTELKLAAFIGQDRTLLLDFTPGPTCWSAISMQCLSHALIVHLELAAMYEGQIIC